MRMGLLKKKPDWSDEEFRRYWRERHGPLASQLPGLRAYRQNHVVDAQQYDLGDLGSQMLFDGFSQLWFDDGVRMRGALSAGIGADLMRDESHFIGTLHIVAAESRTVVQPPDTQGTLVKRMSVLKRCAGVPAEDFRREWSEGYAGLVQAMPGVRGYRQNRVVERERVKGTPCAYEALPIDGIAELWFDDLQSMERAFSSAPGREAMAHAKTFAAEITRFLVREYRVV
jgi:uncharacterized protein (TIGR02118 family)